MPKPRVPSLTSRSPPGASAMSAKALTVRSLNDGALTPARPTAEAIAKSGAKTAWDALRLTVPNVQLREVRGQPARIQRRGRASIYQEDQVRVILDHVPVEELQVLKQVAASDILTIEVLTGLDATTRYGGASTTGVILISTNTGRP